MINVHACKGMFKYINWHLLLLWPAGLTLICLELFSEERIIALVMIHTSILHTVALELDNQLAPLSFERR